MKSTFQKLLLTTLALGHLLASPAAEPDPNQTDLARLQGDWTLVQGEVDGRSLPAEILKNSARSCQGNETKVILGGQLMMKAKFTLDPQAKPKRIDYEMVEGTQAGQKQVGIYKLEGYRVKFCFAAPGQERPTGFATRAGDGLRFSVWQRDAKP